MSDERDIFGYSWVTDRCLDCDNGYHERCRGYGISRCTCYCQHLEDDEDPA